MPEPVVRCSRHVGGRTSAGLVVCGGLFPLLAPRVVEKRRRGETRKVEAGWSSGPGRTDGTSRAENEGGGKIGTSENGRKLAISASSRTKDPDGWLGMIGQVGVGPWTSWRGKLIKNEDSGTYFWVKNLRYSFQYTVPLPAVPIDLARDEPLSTG